jgi:hypothetical protein
MKAEKGAPTPDDIELVPDAWDRFIDAVKRVARHPPVKHPTGHGKSRQRTKRKPLSPQSKPEPR